MKKTFIILIAALLTVSCSNNNKPAKGYYDTGELKWEIIPDKSNNNLLYGTDYFKNGNIKSKYSSLFINDSVYFLEGPFEEYYSDGALKWKGRYIKDKLEFIDIDSNLLSAIRDNSYIKFSVGSALIGTNDTVYLQEKGMYTFRTNLNNIYPGRYIVFVYDGSYYNKIRDRMEPDADDYPYMIVTPDRDCELDIVCVFADTNGQIIFGQSPSVTFKVKVYVDKPQ